MILGNHRQLGINLNVLVKCALFIILLISIIRYYLEQNTYLSETSLRTTLIYLAIALVLFFIRKESNSSLKNNLLKISTIFILGFVLVHFIDYLGYVCGVYSEIRSGAFLNLSLINEAAICSFCCLITFMLGYLFKGKGVQQKKYNVRIYSFKPILEYGVLIFAVLFYLFTDKEYFNGGYGEVLNSTGLSIISSLSQNFVLACLLGSTFRVYSKYSSQNKITFSKYLSSYPIVFYVGIFFYLILVLISGDRGPILFSTIIFISPYFIINKKKVRFLGLFLCTVMMIILRFLAFLREVSGEMSWDKIQTAIELQEDRVYDVAFFAYTSELSIVARAYHAIYAYENEFGVFWGGGIINHFLGIIPGLRFVLYKLIGFDDTSINTAYIATQQLNSDHGMGTTCVADVYINLGFLGSLVFFFYFGKFIRILDVSLYESQMRLLKYVFSISYLSMAVYLGRATCFSPINLAVMSLIFVWIAMLFSYRPLK